MATTLMPLDPATSPQYATRILTISADLLPEEIVAARRARRTRSWVLVLLALAVVLLGGWYALAVQQKNEAAQELQGLAAEAAALQRSQNNDYADVVEVQSQISSLDNQLKILMADDLPWATLLDTLNSTGQEAGVQVTGVNGTLTATAATSPAAGTTLPSSSGAATIGTLIVTGTAPDKPSIAKFVDALGTLRTVTNPYLTSAAQNQDGVAYSLQLDITSAAQCGRFTTTCKTGGK